MRPPLAEVSPAGAALRPSDEPNHTVHFYSDEASLYTLVTEYLAEGWRNGQRLVVIATPEHRAAFCEQLQASGIDVAPGIRSGQVVLLDARDTLAKFMADDGMPDRARFRATVAPL